MKISASIRSFQVLAAMGLLACGCWNAQAQGSPDIIWAQANNSDRINTVIVTPDGGTVISGGSDRLINFWNASNGSLVKSLNQSAPQVHASSVEALSLNPDGTRLASVSYQNVKIWRLPEGTAQNLAGHTDWVVACDFSPNGAWLATASFDTSVRIWSATDGASIRVLPSGNQMRAVAFSPNSALLASGGGDNTVTIRNTANWTVTSQLTGHADDVDALAFSPDGSLLASGSYDRTVKVWNVADGSLRYTLNGNGGVIYSVAFSPDGTTLAYTDGEGNTIRLVRASDGSTIRTYTQNVDAVQTLAFSPQGPLAFGRVDRTVVLANVGTGVINPNSITITAPANGRTFSAPANITINANPVASSGIASVEFFQNGTSLGVDNAGPFTFNWTDVPPGNYSLTATLTATDGSTASAAPVSIVVNDPSVEHVAPRVSITAPASNARVTASPMVLQGKASDNIGVSSVQVSLNSGDFQTADGTTNWQLSLDLVPGVNTVQVKSVDTSGNESSIAKRSFTFLVTSPLAVTVSGNGRVSPTFEGRTLEVGKRYAINAIPASGSVFNNWTGDITTNISNLAFTMQQNMTLQANFVPNPFIPLQGTYRGVAESDPPTVDGAGFGQFTVGSSGAFSGKVYLGKNVIPLSGKFSGEGAFSKSIARRGKPPVNIDLVLDVTGDSDQIAGTLSDGVVTSALTASRAFFNTRTNPAPQAGRYTFLIPGNPESIDSPEGTSFGTVVIGTSGSVTASGRLADGTSFTSSSALARNGTWPLFAWLSSGNETVSGLIATEDVPGSDMNGTVNWFRRPMRSTLFPGGFDTQVSLVGSRFSPIKGARILDFPDATNNAVVAITGATISPDLSIPATLSVKDRVTSEPAGSKDFKATISRSTGTFSGTFLNPATNKSVPFSGAVLQKTGVGGGFFLLGGQSGSVLISQASPP